MDHVKELTLRVRANEKVVASISLLGVIACTFIGAGYFAPKAEACSLPADGRPANCPENWELGVKSDPTPGTPIGVSRQHRYSEKYSYRPEPYQGMLPDNSATVHSWMNKMKQWELEQTMRDPEFDINSALAEYFNGSDDTSESEELLQFSSDGNSQSLGWRYD